jgi:hypothetical protein
VTEIPASVDLRHRVLRRVGASAHAVQATPAQEQKSANHELYARKSSPTSSRSGTRYRVRATVRWDDPDVDAVDVHVGEPGEGRTYLVPRRCPTDS